MLLVHCQQKCYNRAQLSLHVQCKHVISACLRKCMWRVRKNSMSRAHARTHACFAERRLAAVILSAKPTLRDFSRHRSGQALKQKQQKSARLQNCNKNRIMKLGNPVKPFRSWLKTHCACSRNSNIRALDRDQEWKQALLSLSSYWVIGNVERRKQHMSQSPEGWNV